MEQEKRTLEVIREEYKGLCNAAGQLQYQMKVMERELDAVVQRMSEVNIEASKAVEEAAKQTEGAQDGASKAN